VRRGHCVRPAPRNSAHSSAEGAAVDELRKGLQTLVAATEVLEKKYASARRVKHAMEDE
jgi:hypothetical protein